MISRRRHQGRAWSLTRDIVEVAAIVLAGAWAIYTFVYVERIKPSYDQPRIAAEGALTRVGTRNGLVALEYAVKIRNAGSVPVSILGAATSAIGIRFTTSRMPQDRNLFAQGEHEFSRDARVDRREVVYSLSWLSRSVDPKFGSSYVLAPGQEVPFSGIFLVKARTYDTVEFAEFIAYAKPSNSTYNITARTNSSGITMLDNHSENQPYYFLEAIMGRTMLW
jgi:hypothetical protein